MKASTDWTLSTAARATGNNKQELTCCQLPVATAVVVAAVAAATVAAASVAAAAVASAGARWWHHSWAAQLELAALLLGSANADIIFASSVKKAIASPGVAAAAAAATDAAAVASAATHE